jgi:hypothetical protein
VGGVAWASPADAGRMDAEEIEKAAEARAGAGEAA